MLINWDHFFMLCLATVNIDNWTLSVDRIKISSYNILPSKALTWIKITHLHLSDPLSLWLPKHCALLDLSCLPDSSGHF